jgi:hypothetical protein
MRREHVHNQKYRVHIIFVTYSDIILRNETSLKMKMFQIVVNIYRVILDFAEFSNKENKLFYCFIYIFQMLVIKKAIIKHIVDINCHLENEEENFFIIITEKNINNETIL